MTRILPAREVIYATPRTRIIRIGLEGQPFPFTAGQAVIVGLADSRVRRPYSIACSPADARAMDAIELLVQIDEPDPSDPHLERTAPGTPLAIEGPFGTFGLPSPLAEREVLFIAGGTGIAPLRSMLRDLIERSPDRDVTLIYSARTATEFAYEKELRQLASAGRINLRLTVTRADDAAWPGNRGRIDANLIRAAVTTDDIRCVLCGPAGMVAAGVSLLRDVGVSPERIVTETYGS